MLDVLRAQGLAYVRFATETPELYRIATMSEGTLGSDVDTTLNTSAFVHMRDSVQALMDEGIYPSGDPTALALELWSAAHGVAALLIAKPYLPFGDDGGVRRPGDDARCARAHRGRCSSDRTRRRRRLWSGCPIERESDSELDDGASVQPVLRPGVDRVVRT